MTNSIDQAYERLLKIKSELELALLTGPNEADTRLKVLDRFLFEVLEWKLEAVFAEPPTPSGYIDYLLTIAERRGAMVVEAKKAGRLTPATKSEEAMVVSLSGPVVKPLLEGIKQAMRYALENGVAVAAVTDGSAWLFFRASRTDGQPPLQGKGILFPNFAAVLHDFGKFFELLNVGAIVERRHIAHLADAEGLAVPDAEQQFYVSDPGEASMRARDPLASENDYVSGFIGRLGNFDIRRMLKIAERIFLSPELKIDDIIKSKFGGEDVTADRFRTHRALIRGEYDRFSERENEFISNLFQTDPQHPGPPLLGYYLLWVLRQKLHSARNKQDENIESSHWAVSDLVQLFEGCGVSEDLVIRGINRLYDRRLIEALDPNVKRVNNVDKVAIKESGLAHLELLLTSEVYVEQMALTTGVKELFTRDEIRRNNYPQRMRDVRETFLRYILKIDAGRLTVPTNPIYSQLQMARRQVESLMPQRRPIREV